jgi:hypothetical protein
MDQSTSPSNVSAAPPSASIFPPNKAFRDGVQFAWDSTSIKSFDTCPRYYYYKHIEGWYTFGKSVHLRFGAIYATALEHYAKHRALGMERDAAIVEVVHEALIATWDYSYTSVEAAQKQDPLARIEGSGKPWDSGDTHKTRSTLIRTIVWYFEHFEDDLEVIKLSNGKPAVEYSFKLPVENDIIFCGHIDKLVEYGGSPMVMDQKTTKSTVGHYYFDQFAPDVQMSMYTFAGKIIYDMPIKGVIIDAAQVAINFTRFERGVTFRTDSQLNEWYDNVMSTIERAQHAARENHFPMNTTACGNYGGCDFRHICSKAPEVRNQFLAGNFTRAPTWDPMTER